LNAEAARLLRRQLPPDMAVEPWLAPDGWTFRSFRLPAAEPGTGEILFLGGRGDFFEKYLEAIVAWRDAGWTVSGFDWRGQGGSGRLRPGDSCHIDDFSTLVDDLEAFAADWRSKGSGPRVAIAHSMGAHILMRAVLSDRVSFDGIVLLSPMLGIRAGPLAGKALHALASLGSATPLRERPIWRGQRSPAPGRVTSCPERQADKIWWKSERPELGRGAPTWGWLAAATRSIAELDAALAEKPPSTPGLLLAAAGDPIVDPQAIDRAATLLPTFEYRLVGQSGHELLRERDGPRTIAMTHIAAFLDRIVARSRPPERLLWPQ
jgi:lysophospholipase